MRTKGLALASSLGLLLVAGLLQGASVTPVVWGDDPGETGNPDCSDVCSTCGYYELKIEPPQEGTFYGPGGFEVTISNATWKEAGEMMSFDWSSNYPVYAVIVKAGPLANVYNYDPPVTSDTDLGPPGRQAISHITFCYKPPEITVTVSGLSDLTIDQPFIGQGNQYGSLGTLSVSITASVSYTASVYYTYTIVTGSTSPFTGDPLSLQADSGTWYTIPEYPSSIILPDFSGSPGTESHDYPVRVELSLLGDRDAGDVIQFTVHVTVSASSP